MKLTSHTTSMDLMIQFSGDGMVPRQRFRPIPQLFMGAPSEQGAEQLMAHRQVMENLQHIEENSNRHGEQYNRLERTHHVEQLDGSNWNEPTSNARGILQTLSENVIGGEASREEDVTERTL